MASPNLPPEERRESRHEGHGPHEFGEVRNRTVATHGIRHWRATGNVRLDKQLQTKGIQRKDGRKRYDVRAPRKRPALAHSDVTEIPSSLAMILVSSLNEALFIESL